VSGVADTGGKSTAKTFTWLRLACRWEGLLQRGGAGLEADQKPSFERVFNHNVRFLRFCVVNLRLTCNYSLMPVTFLSSWSVKEDK
jgi:hypothetical protein